jgi:hypothetical protein
MRVPTATGLNAGLEFVSGSDIAISVLLYHVASI